MKINAKHVIEFAGGIVIGNLVSGAAKGIVKASKEKIKEVKNKKEA